MTTHLKSRLLLSAILLIIHISPTKADFVGIGACPNPTAATGTITLNGVWFEQQRYDSVFSHSLQCVKYSFTPAATGALTALNINAIYKLTGRTFQLNGRVIPTPTGSTTNYAIQFNNINLFQQNFRVIGFLANTYAVLFSCTNYGFFYSAQVVALTRAQIPNPADLTNAINVVRAANLPVWLLRNVDQTLC